MDNAREVVRAGLIGSSIQGSRTPTMHMCEGAAQGLAYSYDILDLDVISGPDMALGSLMNRLEAEGYAGVNVTHPCKQQVIPLLTELTADTRAIGAVNTVTFDNGKRVGRNTDWWGFAEAFRKGLPNAELDRVMLLGAGGAGAAVAFALTHLGAKEVVVSDIDAFKADTVVDRMNSSGTGTRFSVSVDFPRDLAASNGLVHTTPTGMAKYPGIALDPGLLSERHWVSEVVYVPLETELVRDARARGCRVLDGSGMAVFQAVRAFELFTGLPANAQRMFLHFKEYEKAHAVT